MGWLGGAGAGTEVVLSLTGWAGTVVGESSATAKAVTANAATTPVAASTRFAFRFGRAAPGSG